MSLVAMRVVLLTQSGEIIRHLRSLGANGVECRICWARSRLLVTSQSVRVITGARRVAKAAGDQTSRRFSERFAHLVQFVYVEGVLMSWRPLRVNQATRVTIMCSFKKTLLSARF